jgi:hypothetical protein
MRINSAGNVGIGTTSPVGKIDYISGSARVYMSDQGSAGFITAVNTTNTAYAPLAINGSLLFFKTGDAERMRIDGSGNVGICTSSPTGISGYTALEINNATNGAILDLAQADTMRGRLVATASSFSLETSGSIPLIFAPTGTERARIDASGNLLVGTTSSSGSASNTARVIGGIFSTLRSSASVANNTATTIATLPAGEGNYMVSASLSGSSVPADFNEVAMVRVSETTSSLTVLVNAAQLSLSMSGLNLQVTHLQGATQTIQYSVLRIL